MKQFLLVSSFLCTFSLMAQLVDIAPPNLSDNDFFGFNVDIHQDDMIISAGNSGVVAEGLGALYLSLIHI